MSYTVEEKKEALVKQNKAINELGTLDVIDMEGEQNKWVFWFVLLVSVGLCCVAFCIVVYGS